MPRGLTLVPWELKKLPNKAFPGSSEEERLVCDKTSCMVVMHV